MNIPKINLPPSVKPKEPPKAPEVAKIANDNVPPVKASVDTSKLKHSRTLADADHVPANWVLLPTDDGKVFAKNNVTGNEFVGTTKEFSEHIKKKAL